MAEAIGRVDVVITTALVPGRRAPILVTEEAVKLMKPGSVVVDLAGEQGGNCELSKPGETVLAYGVKVIAPLNLPSTLAEHASMLYARNIQALLELMIKDGAAGARLRRRGDRGRVHHPRRRDRPRGRQGRRGSGRYASGTKESGWTVSLSTSRCWCWPDSSATR